MPAKPIPVVGPRLFVPRALPGSWSLPSSDGLSRPLLFEHHRYRPVCREANPLPLDFGDQPEVDEMRVVLVLALAAVALGEPDATVSDTVDGADVNAVRADHFHGLLDLVRGHLVSPCGFADCGEAKLARPAVVSRFANACAPGKIPKLARTWPGGVKPAPQHELAGHKFCRCTRRPLPRTARKRRY